MSGNFAPVTLWFETPFPRPNSKRSRLYVNGMETPFFIDTEESVRHRAREEKHDLYGSGMSPSGSARHLGSASRIADLKHKAEQMAFAA